MSNLNVCKLFYFSGCLSTLAVLKLFRTLTPNSSIQFSVDPVA